MRDWQPPLNEWRDAFDDLSIFRWSNPRFQAEMEMEDGTLVTGQMDVIDDAFDGEDDYPIWGMLVGDKEYLLAGAKRYRAYRIASCRIAVPDAFSRACLCARAEPWERWWTAGTPPWPSARRVAGTTTSTWSR